MKRQTYKWAWHIQKSFGKPVLLEPMAREEVQGCDDEVKCKTQFMMALWNLHFILRILELLEF